MLASKSNRLRTPCDGSVAALITRCGDGDEAALGALFDALGVFVYARVAAWSREDTVDDAVFAAFVNIWERSASFGPGAQNGVDWVLEQVADLRVGDTGFESDSG